MSKFIRDVFQTQKADGTYAWDLTNPGFSAMPWIFSIFVYLGLGVYHGVTAPGTFSLMDFATGAAALFAGGGVGVFAHSKAQV